MEVERGSIIKIMDIIQLYSFLELKEISEAVPNMWVSKVQVSIQACNQRKLLPNNY